MITLAQLFDLLYNFTLVDSLFYALFLGGRVVSRWVATVAKPVPQPSKLELEFAAARARAPR